MKKSIRMLAGWTSLIGVTLAAACSSGSGTTPNVFLGFEGIKGDYQKPGEDGQDPPPGSTPPAAPTGQTSGTSGTQIPGTSGTIPGTSGTIPGTSGTSGTSGTVGACHPCDGSYICQKTGGGTPSTVQFNLQPGGVGGTGSCREAASGLASLACGGAVKNNTGGDVGTWVRSGSTTIVKIGADNYTCTKGTITDAGGGG